MSHQPTGNPVFDFQADARVRNAAIQKWATLGGLALFVIGCFALLVARTSPDLRAVISGATLLGIVLFFVGLFWGFFWRKNLQRQFREKYGNETAQ